MEWNVFNEQKGMEWNRMEQNGMKLRLGLGVQKGREWNGIELSNLVWMF